ncbi:hypothetical protein TBLA_0I01260 [Henningerozyma blattae CBS 6284]|uniref:Protein KTI12 n=1 Tax=Henningerozyma blattae (strain ATCC 34711 / CBS 6284 / DSM 70876 / NBRC 10599 / NRRL Y-10934 / UCD 77-7) TaxID=1071380 RepID=I2H8T4_HENB6|nr:hypothetical protein TBLA_0I01260 [Tetrapisispora blattae CBS 6284]CCH62786.1 hypothetical protein TBLA_0I01260 [Tetrapisispora blattae CBS 6284]
MPLILFTGFPSSGKSTKAQELIGLLNEHIEKTASIKDKNYKIIYHNDETLGINHEDYITSTSERKLRSEIMSVVKRDLSRNNIVIIDSLNYIKGFRYQLHCEVKNVSTTFCLIHVMCPLDTINDWNKKSKLPWDTELLNQLIQRYEEPNGNNRWDSPLFPIMATQDSIGDFFEDITRAVFNNGKSSDGRDPLIKSFQKSNAVSILKPASNSNYIQLLDSQTSKVIKIITDYIKMKKSIGETTFGGRIIVSEVSDINDERCAFVDLPYTNSISLPMLQRMKRQFVKLNKLRSIDNDRIVTLFASYLTKQLSDL